MESKLRGSSDGADVFDVHKAFICIQQAVKAQFPFPLEVTSSLSGSKRPRARLSGKRIAIFCDFQFEDLEVTYPKIRYCQPSASTRIDCISRFVLPDWRRRELQC